MCSPPGLVDSDTARNKVIETIDQCVKRDVNIRGRACAKFEIAIKNEPHTAIESFRVESGQANIYGQMPGASGRAERSRYSPDREARWNS